MLNTHATHTCKPRIRGVQADTQPTHASRACKSRVVHSDRACSPRASVPRIVQTATGAPAGLFEQWWDVILVDAPMGFVPTEHPGRLAPIYMSASMLARQRARRPCAAVDVFVHDFDRRAEREWGLTFLTPHSRLVNAADGLALQRAKQGGGTVDGAKYMAWFHSP
uniref:Uncharacterized protein n=1 Tax=Chrysotila carterae TaxID=13221 RepID=A0A6T0BQT0_CHRCT